MSISKSDPESRKPLTPKAAESDEIGRNLLGKTAMAFIDRR